MKNLKIGRVKLNIKHLIILILSGILFFLVLFPLFGKKETKIVRSSLAFLNVDVAYADTTLKYISDEGKIGQMIIADFGRIDSTKNDTLTRLLYTLMPGGIIYQTDSISEYIQYQNIIQKYSGVNPFVFLPQEYGIFKFEEMKNFPDFNVLSAVVNDSVKRNYIKMISNLAKQINLSGLSFDDNFTENRIWECRILNSLIYQINSSNKLMTFADASQFLDVDSTEFANNMNLISNGLTGIILNEDENSNVISQIKNKYNFDGLFIKRINSNQLNSDFVTGFVNSGTSLFITRKPNELQKILLKAIDNELIDKNVLTASVRKNLLAKTWTDFNNNKRILYPEVDSLFKNPFSIIAENSVFKNSIALLKNDKEEIPFKNLRNARFNLLVIGKNDLPKFKQTFNSYYYAKSLFANISDKNFRKKIQQFKKKNNLIIALNKTEIDSDLIAMIFEDNKKSVVLLNFGEPNNLNYVDSISSFIQIPGNSVAEQKYAAEALFGGTGVNGKFPCTYEKYTLPDTFLTSKKIRVSECLPEEVGLNSKILSKIDSIAKDGIRRGAFPGCQVVVLKNGCNVYEKSFGFHTYSKTRRVKNTDLYDLASVTKIAATTTAAMKLYSQGRLRLNDKLGRFFRDTEIDYSNIKPDTIINIDTLKYKEVADFKKILRYQDTLRINDSMFIAYDSLIVTVSPKNNIFKVKIRDLLLHKSGITPTLPILPYVIFKKNFYDSLEINKQRFYEDLKNDTTIENKNIEFNPRREIQKIYDTYFTKHYIKDSAEIRIADGFYFKNNWFDTLWRDTKRLRVYSRKIYQYSDINMILLQSAIDTLNRRSMNSYMRNTFYLPMGLQTMCYKPYKYFSRRRIVPTENDKYWREQLLRGSVHDPSAAMLGGISGNAGLFSDAYDLAVLGQMWLNGGTYGGMRFISESVVKKFTGFQEDSHRGLGFDKPHKKAIIAKDAPPQSFGHTGFTGTCIWVDPVNDIVFVFLSNRVNPSAKNWRINTLKIRQKMHQVVYDAMK